MAHEDVVEAAVIGVPYERWQERPVGYVVVRDGADVTVADLRTFLEGKYPNWWLPDDIVFIKEVPKTATGKFDKKVLRDRFDDSIHFTSGE